MNGLWLHIQLLEWDLSVPQPPSEPLLTVSSCLLCHIKFTIQDNIILLSLLWNSTAPSAPPQNVTVVDVQSTFIMLTWSPPPEEAHNGEIIHYAVTAVETQTDRITTATSTNTAIALGNLHPFYYYDITVAAYTVGTGPSSTSVLVQTLEDGEYSCKQYIRIITILCFPSSAKCSSSELGC